MGYNSPPGDEITQLFSRIDDALRRIAELERPTGTQVYAALAELRQLVEDLPGQINTALAISVSTGTLTTTGNVTAGADINVTGDIYTPHGRATPVVVSYVAAYLDSVGRLGATPSSVEYKQDIEPADADALVDALLHASLVRFRYIQAVEELGEDAPSELGAIAEYFDAIGLSEYVFYHEDGTPMGIKYERLSIPLIAVVQKQRSQIESLTQRMVAAGF